MRIPLASRQLAARALFSLGARAYDRLVSQGIWRSQILRLLDHAPGVGASGPVQALDLGTGPGISAFVLADALPDGSEVIGVDLSPAMIARARRHHRDRWPHLTGVRFVEGDAASLDLEAGRFDLVTGHSFLYLLPDPVAVLREVRRVLAPGGVAVFLEPRSGGSLSAAARAAGPWLGEALNRSASDVARFAASMVLWRWFSATQGRFNPARAEQVFVAAGFDGVATASALGGLGLHCVARA